MILRPQKGPQEQFLATRADIAIYGGAAGGGKTYALLLEPLRHMNVEGYSATIFRKNATQITIDGGLLDESMQIYGLLRSAVYKASPKPHWILGGKAKVSFMHIDGDRDLPKWQGSQICFLGFDELCHFSEMQFFYMLSRNRSTCGVKPYVRATCNPDVDSWVAKFISWWIDQETGYPIPERSGVLRYFCRDNAEVKWGDSPEELSEKYGVKPELCKSVTFIASSIYDNKILLERDPSYLANLHGLSLVERERLLKGNWKIRPDAGYYFKRSKIGQMLSAVPADIVRWVRAWDLAATVSIEDEDSACTAGVLMGKRKDGRIFVADVINVRENGADVRRLIKNTALSDNALYGNVTIRLPQDPGQAGKDQIQSFVRMLGGFHVVTAIESGDKVTRAEPFSSQWLAGNVGIREAEWNDEYFRQLENFPVSKLKDMVDASANAYLELENEKAEFGLFKASTVRYFRTVGECYQLITPDGFIAYEKNKCRLFQTCDVAGSTKSSADYFVLGTFALCPNGELLLLDILRERLEGPNQPMLIKQKFDEYTPAIIGVEGANMGLTLYHQLRRSGLPVIELKPDADKYTRAIPVAMRYEAGMVYHLEGADWLRELEAELLEFPNGMHDDQVDVISYAVYMQSWGYLNVKKRRSRALVLG